MSILNKKGEYLQGAIFQTFVKGLDATYRGICKEQKTFTVLAIIRGHARRDFTLTLIW
jgi:hypothetical protein